jgi:hypothetical protein
LDLTHLTHHFLLYIVDKNRSNTTEGGDPIQPMKDDLEGERAMTLSFLLHLLAFEGERAKS